MPSPSRTRPAPRLPALALAGLVPLAACAADGRAPVAPPPTAAPPPVPSATPDPPATSTPDDDPEARARALVDDLAHHRYDAAAARFDPELLQALPGPALGVLWQKIEEAGGPFARVEGAESTVESDLRVVRVICRFAHLRKVLRVIFGEDGAIAGLYVEPHARDLEDAARAVVDRLSREDWQGAGATFDAILRGSLPPDKLHALWARTVKKSGAFVEVESAAIAAADGLAAVLLTCRFASGAAVVKVVYDLRDQVAGFFILPGDFLSPWRPPAYATPDRFTERDIAVGANPALPGTLTLPKGSGPFPAVVLVHGSGPSDADATQGPNRIFKDLAWGLASRDVAVIRYVKRTKHAPAGVATIKEEVLEGARAAVDLALHTREIDPRKVVVVGHSQGGYLAPRIAAEVPGVAGIVLLAGPSRPLQDSLVDQLSYFLKLDPRNAEKQRMVTAARECKARIEDPGLDPAASIELPDGAHEKGSYFLSLRGYRPTEVAAGLTIPILVLQGDRDYQVTHADFEGWRRALAGRPGVTLKRYPALNHLFIAGSGTPRPGEYESPGHVDAAVVSDVAAFMGKL
ncbi:MAG: alpha/beta fold hydrolase [Minicystis sp.]